MIDRNFSISLLLVTGQIPLVAAAGASKFQTIAVAGTNALQGMYDRSNGLWKTSGWWNAANCLTSLADLTSIYPDISVVTGAVWDNTWAQAQQENLKMQKLKRRRVGIDNSQETLDRRSLEVTALNKYQLTANTADGASSTNDAGSGFKKHGFLNDFYDDEGWWALAWTRVYDVTGNAKYLRSAQDIFDDMVHTAANATCGGIWWDRPRKSNNAISNELFLSVAAHLANRVPAKKRYYTNWANDQWNWFQRSGLINPEGNINDGLDLKTCKNNGKDVWSYNQGVILGALVELNKASPSPNLIPTARRIANAALRKLTDGNGVLHDPHEPDLGVDGPQFKGVFMRNLRVLQQATGDPVYKQYIERNAAAIWTKARDSRTNLIGNVWTGPVSKATASSQSSALDALVAAAAMQ